MGDFWQNKIKAFLHDPPDKALILFHKSHIARRDNILDFIGLDYESRLDTADHIASAMQRLDIPKEYRMDDAGSCSKHICFRGRSKPIFRHTLSAGEEKFQKISDFIATYGYEKTLDKYGFDITCVESFVDKTDWKKTYFMIWRFLPEKYPLGYFLPADTRIPDHSIWDHLDVTAAISACLGDLGLLAVKMSGVQEFISHSRKLSDLWAASHLYSSLIFEGIKVIADELGPDVMIYPQLRENSLFDLYLKERFSVDINVNHRLMIANLPNVFLCFIPQSKAMGIAKKCKNAIKDKWREFSKVTKDKLKSAGVNFDENLWDKQIENAIVTPIAWLAFMNLDSYKKLKESLPEHLVEKQEEWLDCVEEKESRTNYGHFYFPVYELLLTLLVQNSRLFNFWEECGEGRKCLMCGIRYAVIDESKLKNTKFETVLKKRERLCAVCAIKRIYREIFEKVFKSKSPPFESVVDIAGRTLIEMIKLDEDLAKLINTDVELIYEHEWESKEKKDAIKKLMEDTKKSKGELKKKLRKYCDIYGNPKRYYAILKMDGDHVGKILSGETLPSFGEFFHPVFKNKIEEWRKGEKIANMKRMLSPSIHMAISRAMKNFSILEVPDVVSKYDGFLVYSGGDDVLALFPIDKVLDVAKELQESFRRDFYEAEVNGKKKRVMGLGKNASMSAGIIFVHYKYPLYDAIEKTRVAEKYAKEKYGRNAFCMTFIKHSGEMISAGGEVGCC